MSLIIPEQNAEQIPDETEEFIEILRPRITAYQINYVYEMSTYDYFRIILFFGSAIFVAMIIAMIIIQKSITSPLPVIKRSKEEQYYLDPNSIRTFDFPLIDDEPTVYLSVIIPAYNEEERLPIMLDECLEYLEKKATGPFSYEVIVVSDGSRDSTVAKALKYSKKYTVDKFRVLELNDNRGKGGAIRMGMLSARGKFLLFADADGATKFQDYEKLESAMASLTTDYKQPALVIGSRAHLEAASIASRSAFRNFLMHSFHFLVWLFAVRKIRDTQCGFKLFTRAAAKQLFNILHVERWAFDVELLYIAQRLNMPITEVAVNWKEVDGSKLTPFWSWIEMGTDLFLIWFRYSVRAWKIQDKQHTL